MTDEFVTFFKDINTIRLREPLAEALGALNSDGILEYSFADAVKLAGHACPTIAGAYLVCERALRELYPDEVPVRGEIEVKVYGEPDEGTYGVMAQVFSLLTGAAPATGFKGLAYKYKRKDLLKYAGVKIDPAAACFEFRRTDTGKAVLVKLYPGLVPFPPEKAERLGQLIQQVVWDAASAGETQEFRSLWMEKVKTMLVDRKEIYSWLKTERRN
ncbi:MAG: hypothetical protein HYX96_08425 [Chloroflexi bacterium]|nr:hypothetical protein [Chloroflexota bacterium]